MSKYNHIHSIPVESVSEEEINQVIHEWAEGNFSLEKFLLTCYQNNIKTNGCHAGSSPYIGFDYNRGNDRLFEKLILTTLSFKDSQILIRADGGNPFSGPNWYFPCVTIGFFKKNQFDADLLIDALTDVINKKYSVNTKFDLKPLFILFHFLINKYCGLLIRIRHTNKDIYSVSFEKSFSENQSDLLDDWNSFFCSIGLTYIPSNYPIKEWKYESSDLDDFMEHVNYISDYIVHHYSFPIPRQLDKENSLNINAHIMRDECLKSGDFTKFDLWLKKEEMRINHKSKRYRIRRKFTNLFHFFHHKM